MPPNQRDAPLRPSAKFPINFSEKPPASHVNSPKWGYCMEMPETEDVPDWEMNGDDLDVDVNSRSKMARPTGVEPVTS
jgi:hypothetical protein